MSLHLNSNATVSNSNAWKSKDMVRACAKVRPNMCACVRACVCVGVCVRVCKYVRACVGVRTSNTAR